jgi:GNAT superfamily N-acetyltransferase
VPADPPALADSVRLAWPAEAEAIAALQRRGWAATLPPEVADPLLDGVDVAEMTQAWAAVLGRPADARQRVLVAVDGSVGDGRPVGFATTVPAQDDDAEPGVDGEVDQFWIDPPAQRRGHGSRLLNACADTLRADGFRRARWWVSTADDVLRAFLTGAGWAPDGAHREIGSEDGAVRIRQVRLHTDLGDGS